MMFSSKFMSRMLAVDPALGALMGDGTFSPFTILFLNFVPPSADPFVGFSGRGSSTLESILAKSPTFRFRPVQGKSIILQKRFVDFMYAKNQGIRRAANPFPGKEDL